MITTHSIGSKAKPRTFLNRSLNLFMAPGGGNQDRTVRDTEAKRKDTESA